MATTRRDDVPLASARSGQRERVFMITGIGVHDRTDRPFKITGMRRSHSAAFKRQVAEEFIAGETLHALSKRHDISRQLIRIWVGKFEAGDAG